MLAIVTTFYSKIGGISTFVKEVEVNTKKITSNVVIFSPDISESDISEYRVKIKGIDRLLLIINLFHKLYKNKPETIQCHGAWYLQVGCLLFKYYYKAFGGKTCLVFIKHSDIVLKKKSIKLRVFKFIDNLGDNLVFVSEYLKEKYISEFGYVFNGRVLTIPPGCSKPRDVDKSMIEKITAIRNGKGPVLTYIGLFEYDGKVSGLCLLLESVRLLKKKYKDIFLIICGHGSKESIVKNKIEALNLIENVVILGNVVNVNNALSLSDVHCHISFQEGFGLVVLEGLAAGVPVVATSVGDLQKVDVNGLFIVEATPEAICEEISNILENRPYVDQAKIMKKYNWANTANSLYNIGQMGNDQIR